MPSSTSNPPNQIPDITTLIDAARSIVFAARRKDQLQNLTTKTVRKQIEHEFALSAGSLDSDDLKVAIRNAVSQAVLDDLPEELPTGAPKNKTAPEAKNKAVGPKKRKSSSSDNKRAKKPLKSKQILDSDEDGDINEMPTIHIARRAPAVTERKSLTEPENKKKRDTGEKSESELSVLIDDGPLKKKRKTRDTKTKTTQVKKKDTASKKPETEEETIKRLKTFVSACGARKQWSKEFADLPEPKQQIKHLKTLLADLGMKGRYSMEKAKAIKLQRDLRRELADVQEFERKAGMSRAERRKQDAKKKPVGELDTQSEESEESEESSGEGSDRRKRRKTTASRQIREYLAKQNDSDED